jgi:DNA-binding PadR family transcriptional regulator
MTVPRTVAEILRDHVTLEVEGIDRMYVNAVVPILQGERGIAWFFRDCRGHTFASSALMAPMTRAFVEAFEEYASSQGVDLVVFEKGQRKDDVAAEYRKRFHGEEGVVFVGKAQERAPVFRTERRRDAQTGVSYAWLYRSTAMVNQYYVYALDRDFGPFFLKFCSYFPYNAKLCINGHEYVKRQLDRRGIRYEALDNGILSCDDPAAAQRICDELSADKIDGLFRKWLRRIPHPFTAKDRAWGIRYELSILQAEFSLTQVLDRPVTGRVFFEEVIRENLDIGRPDQVQLIFDRKLRRKGPRATPGRFRTRVITEGVYPSLHIDYKATRIKQYHKEGRALRTETTINNTRDFEIGKRLHNLPALREVGFRANRRLLDVQRISHDCSIGEVGFHALQRPRVMADQRASALRFADERVQALLHGLVLFRLLPNGFSNRDLQQRLEPLRGRVVSPGAVTYDLRRLRLHGLIRRKPRTHRYYVTDQGLRYALFFTRAYDRLIRPGLSAVLPDHSITHSALRTSFRRLEEEMDSWTRQAKLAS